MSTLSNIVFESRTLFTLGNAALAYGAVKAAPKLASAIAAQIFQKGAPEALTRLSSYTAIRLLPALPFAYMTTLALVHIAICKWDSELNGYALRGTEEEIISETSFNNMPCMEKLDAAFDKGKQASILFNIAFASRTLFALGNAALAYGAVKAAPKLAHAIAAQIFQKGAPEALNRLASYRFVRYFPALPFAYMTMLALVHIATHKWDEADNSYKIDKKVDSREAVIFDNLPFMERLHGAFNWAALTPTQEDFEY